MTSSRQPTHGNDLSACSGRPASGAAEVSLSQLLLDPRRWLLALSLAMLLTMPGCGGCRSSAQTAAQKKKAAEEKKKKEEEEKKKKKKPDFEVSELRLAPLSPESKVNYVKPGHWVSTQQLMRANNFDFSADVVLSARDRSNQPVLVEGTPYYLRQTRPTALAKGQMKYIEAVCPVPSSAREGRMTMLSSELVQRRTRARAFGPDTYPTARMMDYQYLFLILSSAPDNFSYVKILHAVDPPLADEENNREVMYYHVIAPKFDKQVPIPSHSLTWTSIAYLLWDRVDVELLTEQQKLAIVDWLHWGGQLIINGPDNLDALRNSFLADYLPADDDGAAELTNADFSSLNEHWSLYSNKHKKQLTLDLLENEQLLGVKLKLRPEAQFVPDTGDLVAERQVGRGRVVTTAFSLAARHVKRWGCLDNFFNCCLLRRPAREFFRDEAYMPTMRLRSAQNPLDPRFSSQVRYFTRDLPGPIAVTSLTSFEDANGSMEGYGAWKGVGNAGWNDQSGAAVAARQALKEAAGITVPEAGFVLRSVGIYLLVLVPLNWLFFRLINRVEWAWVAAPIIAIIGSLYVVHYAQLDIGFARSLNETAVLELQGGYPRGHLTRFTALYTSLSTEYDLEMDDPTALAMPFSPNMDYRRRLHDRTREVTLKREGKVTLSGYQVSSNTTGMLHSEQMFTLGAVKLVEGANGPQLDNQTELKLLDAMVLHRSDDGELQRCYLGAVEPQASRPLQFVDLPALDEKSLELDDRFNLLFPEWENSSDCSFSTRQAISGELSLRGLCQLATNRLAMGAGEYRLIAWTDQALSGAATRPAPAQATHRTLVISHLRRGGLPKIQSDRTLLVDFAEDDNVLNPLLDDPTPSSLSPLFPGDPATTPGASATPSPAPPAPPAAGSEGSEGQ
ncbi:MAG: hypothetical protein KDB14_17500 [Planctomycetales bacterium]|nr:hypothetical protein [Planctomycetales bacterium]